MGTLIKFTTTATLAVGLQLCPCNLMTGRLDTFAMMTTLQFNQKMLGEFTVAQYQPKDNGGPQSGEDAGSHWVQTTHV